MRDERRSFTIERSAAARCSPETLMTLIRTPATWHGWQSEIIEAKGARYLELGDVVRGRAAMMGFDVDGQSVTESAGPTWISQDVVVGVGMKIRYDVSVSDGAVTVTHRLISELPAGALGVVLSLFLRWRLRKMQKMLLEELVAQAEASSG